MPDRTLKILIADDHPIVRAGIKAVLSDQPRWTICAEAENGTALLRLAFEQQPDIAIIDYGLPVLNGLEAARQMRQAAPKTQVLMYTMYEDNMLIRDALQIGVRGYILKSEEDENLVTAVQTVASGRTYFSQQVTDCLLGERPDPKSAMAPESLTAREREVVRFVAEGESNKIIAGRLGLSIKTLDAHRTAAMKKLKLRNAVDLARYAIRNKLVRP